ncbi:hypothetical protein ASPZODRAFT_68946 [Penicilliopsis zonata CBS 506.65]|uniref:BTB domain-containing protein n=1 Tax=Penicilliopsis zonata CBS 506.65 TaxID=1073090 RepID=A0A1L9SEI8_9EURO|nr:hypothetical protein ASPZODRAFT_68946 [Penicilliopsis zonata CBS 506.65]OJJ45558.1 hypothetical protein ASPZODRAFT_68946 [Penicilliopsis zonata CBS 506.65]
MISPNAQVQDGENDNNNTTSGGSNSSKGHVNVSATASTSEQVSGYSRPPLRIENGRFRVSAQRLMLASPYFESSLSNSWAEGTTLRARGHLDMVIYDFNPEAILYFLLIIHGLEARIPRMIPLQLLTDFAVLVDYFQAHDAVHIQMGLWISLLAPTIPIILCDDHVKWLCIAWTGRCNETFNHVARLIQRQSKIRIDALVLPIPDVILDSINQTRQNCLRYIIRELWTLIGEFLNGHKGCSFECQALYAGMLMRKLQAEGLFLPLPCRSFDGYSVENVMRFVSSVFFLHIGRRHCPSRAHCNFQDFVRPILDHAEKYASRVKGLGHYLNSAATVSQK